MRRPTAKQRVQVRGCVGRWRKPQLGFKLREVAAHAPGGFFGIPQANGLQQTTMLLAPAGGGFFARRCVCRAPRHKDQRGARHQLAQDAPERVVTSALGDLQVEIAGQADRAVHVAARACRLLVLDAASQAIGDVNTLPLELQGLTSTVTTPAIYALGTVTTVVSFLVMGVAIGLAALLGRRQTRSRHA